MGNLRLDVVVDAPVETVFAAFTDWERQGEWMLGTRVETTDQGGVGVGGGLRAWTGAGPVGFWDTMRITEWDEPYRVKVEHTGNVVRGTGVMEVVALPDDRSRFIWSEQIVPPLGAFGRVGWRVLRAPFGWGVRKSLRDFAEWCEEYPRPSAHEGDVATPPVVP